MSICPCGSQRDFLKCCGIYLKGEALAPTPEALMRSRYTAYSKGDHAYIQQTMRGQPLIDFNADSAATVSASLKWVKLTILASQMTGIDTGTVEFNAFYTHNGGLYKLYENSCFQKQGQKWFYTGKLISDNSFITKIGRNTPCPCGNNKKFKRCHGMI